MLVGVVVVLIAATVVITLAVSHGGGGKNQAALPTPAPTRFGIPSPQPAVSATATRDGVMVLPPPSRTAANGVPLGFPHTTEGAVSAVVRWDSLVVPVNEAREIDVLQTISTQHYLQTDLPGIEKSYQGKTLPSGAWATVTPVGVKVLSADDARVVVALLDSMQVGTAQGLANTFFRTSSNTMVWSGSDWRQDAIADAPATLGTPRSNSPADLSAAGWEEFQIG
jgi:hypothetical protein